MLFSALAASLLPLSALALPVSNEVGHAAPHELAKRQTFSGRATYYVVGLGACGWWNQPSDYIVAQNSAQYGGGYPGPNCGKSITISYGGKTAVATIADECPTCGYGDLDLSQGLFEHFANTGMGQFQMTWWYNDGSSGGGNNNPQPTTTSQTPTSTYTPPSSTYTPPTTTYAPPSTSSTQQAAATTSSSSSASSNSSNGSATTTASGSSSTGIPDTFQTLNGTATATGTAPISQPTYADPALGNLVLLNQAVTYMGNIVVVSAGPAAGEVTK